MLKTSWYRLILLLPLFICMLLCKSAWAENEDRSITSEDGVYTYSMNEDGSVTLCSCDWKTHQTGDDVIVPSMVDGHVVSEIGAKCYAWNNRATIGTLVIPNSIRSIEALAFFELEINHISIPASVEVIEQGAFVTEYTSISVAKGCPDYTAVKGGLYEKSTKTLLAAAHQGVEILDGIRNIGAYACYAIEPETVALSRIPASVEAIGNHAFYTAQLMCAADEAYHIPAATIEEYAFSKAVFKRPYSGKVEITFDEQLTALPDGCFSEAAAKWNSYVKYWDKREFKYKHTYDYFNTSLLVHLPEAMTRIGDSVFEQFGSKLNASWAASGSNEYGSIVLVNGLPAGLTSIGAHSFEIKGTVDLSSPEGFAGCIALKEIGEAAFRGTELKVGNETDDAVRFVLPETLSSIGNEALYIANSSNHTFVLPWNLSSIGENAFNKQFVTLEVQNGSYSESWANEHACRYTTNEEDDLSWLND